MTGGHKMSKTNINMLIRILTAVTFATMVIVNALANILPINGVNTGQVSDSYPNLFAPAGFTFSIWGLIYLLLAVYTVYQLIQLKSGKPESKTELFYKIGIYFSVSSAANIIWIFSWHHYLIPLTMLLMIVILICLIKIMQEIKKEPLSSKEKLIIRLPFSVYFGWITVATIANATTLLVDLGWNRFGLSEQVWMILMVITGAVIAGVTTVRNGDIAYGFVPVWAYIGIIIKHVSKDGFAGQYIGVIITAYICISLLFTVIAYTIVTEKHKAINAL